MIDKLWSLLDDASVDNEYWHAVANDNYNRLYVGSLVILVIEAMTVSYVALVYKQLLYLPLLLIPLCGLNVAIYRLTKGVGRQGMVLVYANTTIALCAGAVWNVVMRGTPQSVPIYMFTVFFVAAAFLIRPRISLPLFVGSEVLFLVSAKAFPSEGLAQPSNVINSILVVVLAWTISAMLFSGHQKQYKAKRLIEDKNEELENLYVTDRLTGLYNRHKLDQELRHQTERADRYGNHLAIILIDVDNFKSVNDAYGHNAGDQALCLIASTIESCLRRTDTLGRWGGEEFMIICPETDIDAAYVVAERVREMVGAAQSTPGQPVTLSLGLSAYVPGEGNQAVLQRTDANLYSAKREGRNKVVRDQVASD